MTVDLACSVARGDLSARLDGELEESRAEIVDAHLGTCSRCRRFERDLSSVRRALRAGPAEEIPDLGPRIMREVRRPDSIPERMWTARLRAAAVGAVAAGLLVAGSLPFTRGTVNQASASEVVRELQAAGRGLIAYGATFEMMERGWHPQVPTRNFDVEVRFRAPEKFYLEVNDRTTYPSTDPWPNNDVTLISDGGSWSLTQPSACPVEVLPGCIPGGRMTTSVTDRTPFDGSTPLPTDLVVPLQSVVDSDGIEVLGTGSTLGREFTRIRLPYRQAAPLVASVQQGGMWRALHPGDLVSIDLDRSSWFPLSIQVYATDTEERRAWARRRGFRDAPGALLLSVRATSFTERPNGSFEPRITGASRSGGFIPGPVTIPEPADTAGLGMLTEGTVGERSISVYSNGLAWLKVSADRSPPSLATARAEEVRLNDGSIAYYLPASGGSARRIDLFGSGEHLSLETNLDREELLRIASSTGFTADALPDPIRLSPRLGVSRVDLDDLPATLRRPPGLPPGYGAVSATRSIARGAPSSLTISYRRMQSDLDDVGIRLLSTSPVKRLVPPSTEFVEVLVDGISARWSAERGELEWLDGRVYRSILAPSFDLPTVLEIARAVSR